MDILTRVGSDPIFLDIIPIRSNSSKVDLDPIRSKIWTLDLSPIQIRSRSSWYPFDPLRSNLSSYRSTWIQHMYYTTDPLWQRQFFKYHDLLRIEPQKWAQNSTIFLKHKNIWNPKANPRPKIEHIAWKNPARPGSDLERENRRSDPFRSKFTELDRNPIRSGKNWI